MLRDQACLSGRMIDETKAGVEELRSKIKEIVDYEGHSLQWLIKSIRSMRMTYALAGGDYTQYSVKVQDFFDKETPKPPAYLKSDQAPISRHGATLPAVVTNGPKPAYLIPESGSLGGLWALQKHVQNVQSNASSYAATAVKK